MAGAELTQLCELCELCPALELVPVSLSLPKARKDAPGLRLWQNPEDLTPFLCPPDPGSLPFLSKFNILCCVKDQEPGAFPSPHLPRLPLQFSFAFGLFLGEFAKFCQVLTGAARRDKPRWRQCEGARGKHQLCFKSAAETPNNSSLGWAL